MKTGKFNLFLIFGCLFGSVLGCQSKGAPYDPDVMASRRRNLVREIRQAGVDDPALLEALSNVPRHLFLRRRFADQFYKDVSLPITPFTTTPKPSVQAVMLDALNLKSSDRVLEVGTGIGYQTALLGELVNEVVSIEIIPETAKKSMNLLDQLGYDHVAVKIGDGYKGWNEKAPYNAIVCLISADEPPVPLVDQLAQGGRLIMAINTNGGQRLTLFQKKGTTLLTNELMNVKLDPMEGKAAGRSLE